MTLEQVAAKQLVDELRAIIIGSVLRNSAFKALPPQQQFAVSLSSLIALTSEFVLIMSDVGVADSNELLNSTLEAIRTSVTAVRQRGMQ